MLKAIKSILFFSVLVLILAGCANMGNPEGGPLDEDPPIMIKSVPALNQTNFKKDRIILHFNEIVVLKDVNKNFIISPPLEKDPKITAMGKKVSIDINNELLDSTTYTVYLGNSIVDNNQGNPLPNLTFSFSTGPVLDSMELSGTLLNAEDLEPLSSAIVGIYSDLSDSAVIKIIPLRIAQTDEQGKFNIKNVAPGKYHIFGMPEMIRNFRYDDPSDRIAFLDSIIIPDYDTIQVSDTIWADTVTVDSIIWRDAISYGPQNINLLSFSEFVVGKNIKKKERKESWRFLYSFSIATDTLPKIRLEGIDADDWYLLEQSVTGDTVMFWITDSLIYNRDTLNTIVDYLKTDSMQIDRWQTDTIKMIYRRPKVGKKKKSKKDEPKPIIVPALTYTSNLSGSLHINEAIKLEFESPVEPFDNSAFLLYQTADTLKKPMKFKIQQDEKLIRQFKLIGNFVPGEAYSLQMDSAAITSIYGHTVNKKTSSFTVNEKDQYGNLEFLMTNQKSNGIVYLLNEKSEKLRNIVFTADQKSISFKLLMPGTYYAMLFYDTNKDGKWTTGNYLNKLQAEEIRYFPKQITIKAYRDYEEDWLPERGRITEQKPRNLIGQKKER